MPCYPSLRRSRTGCRLSLPSERRVLNPKQYARPKRETALVLSQKVQGSVCLLVELENSHECFLWNFNRTKLTHTAFTFLLFLQQFLLTGDVTTVTFCQDVFTKGFDICTGNNFLTDSRLDRHFELLTWNDFLKLINPYRQLLLRLEAPYPQGTQGKRRRR